MKSKPNVKIIVATHKKYQMPEDEMYFPLQVGSELNKKKLDPLYLRDNVGDNISSLNPCFCELTGLYWAWKNLDADYIGLVHYRRHFGKRKKNKNIFKNVLTYDELFPYLGNIKVFVPRKRKYYIETLYSHYAHTHYAIQLDITRMIINEKYPEYVNAYDKVLNKCSGYMFNMMIMEQELLDTYCDWLFDILFELEKRIDMSNLSAFQSRFLGRVSEIIFNVWLEYQISSGKIKKSEIKELPYLHMEKTNWRKKGIAFLKAKFMKKRYEGSF